MPIQNLFPTPIYFDRIDAELHHQLKADVYKYIKENDDLFNTNHGSAIREQIYFVKLNGSSTLIICRI